MNIKEVIIALLVIAFIGIGAYYLVFSRGSANQGQIGSATSTAMQGSSKALIICQANNCVGTNSLSPESNMQNCYSADASSNVVFCGSFVVAPNTNK